MKRLIVAVALSAVGTLASAEVTKIENDVFVTAQAGPLPGTVVLRSGLSYFNSGRKGNAGDALGECWTLVRESDIKRDFAKQPVTKEEILGFSCTRMKFAAP